MLAFTLGWIEMKIHPNLRISFGPHFKFNSFIFLKKVFLGVLLRVFLKGFPKVFFEVFLHGSLPQL